MCYNRGMSEEILIPELTPVAAPAPWEPVEGESEVEYGWFLVYMRKRRGTYKEAAETVGRSYQHIRRLAQRYRWRARRESFYLDEDIELRQVMRDRVASHSEGLTQAWNMCLEWALESVAKHKAEGRYLNPRDAATVLKYGTEALRLLDGQPGAHIAVDLSKASDKELADFEKALKALDSGDSRE